jgi:hypothetical protein
MSNSRVTLSIQVEKGTGELAVRVENGEEQSLLHLKRKDMKGGNVLTAKHAL